MLPCYVMQCPMDTLNAKILHHLRANKACYKFWNQAKSLYIDDILRLYKVILSIVNVRQQELDLPTYIGQMASLEQEFLTLMPLINNPRLISFSWSLLLLASIFMPLTTFELSTLMLGFVELRPL